MTKNKRLPALPLVLARAAAWAVAWGAVVAVALSYQALPDTLPLTRWTSAPKSPLLALRVPLINVFTLALVEVLGRGLVRAPQFPRARAIVTVLLLSAGAKAGIEALGLLLLPRPMSWTLTPLVALVAAGLGTAAFLSRDGLAPRHWQPLPLGRAETAAALAAIAAIAALNLPLVVR